MRDLSSFSDQDIAAKTAYGECRGGGVKGMTSVLNVIVNRANNPGWWGDDIRGVCLKPYQFSCWLESDPNLDIICAATTADPIYAQAYDLATQAIAGTLPDITNGATYYFSNSIDQKPAWAAGHVPCALIAGQQFYCDIA